MTGQNKKCVAVLMGGWSRERDVSLSSGRASANALREAGYDVREIVVEKNLEKLLTDLTPRPDVVFNALHGQGGEDGTVQGVLDMLGLAYTHSGVLASSVAMNKQRTKDVVATRGIRCPDGILLHIDTLKKNGKDAVPFAPPFVVKPNCEGSSVGVFIVRDGDNELHARLDKWDYGHEALVEKFIPGRELSVAVMDSASGDPVALTVTEIEPVNHSFYDYEAKYADGGSRHVVPARIPADVFSEAKRLAALAHLSLGCSGVSRSDFRYDDSKPGASGLYFLETNTQPGMTPTSLVPEQARETGMDFKKLVSWMVENAKCHA